MKKYFILFFTFETFAHTSYFAQNILPILHFHSGPSSPSIVLLSA